MINAKKISLNTVWLIVVLTLGFIMAYPIIYMLLSAFKGPGELFGGGFQLLPETWHFENFINAWKSAPWASFFTNTFIVSASIMFLQMFTCSLAGFAFANIQFKGSKIVFIFLLATSMVPFESTMVPSYLLIAELGLLNTYTALILPSAATILGIFIMRQQFKTMPKELFEAAQMDGASTVRMFFQIALPNAKPSLALVGLLAFRNAWNDYTWPLLITTENNMRTVQMGLRYMIDPERGINWPELLAASTFVTIPSVILFLFIQKYMVNIGLGSATK
ncbi:carbohydrate ABC transporter permease [Bacillus sp. JJ1562]|uniref:carbohydrate ABC transporter permease n=1 Tax=Bacillus sp. JJ1562 TaxID=3122960 RepID=UPI003001B31F